MSMPDITLGYPTKIITPPNLGIISLAGNLDEHHRVTAVDLISRRENVRGAVEEAIARTKPDLIGLSAMTFQYDTALKIAKFIKKTYPKIKTALGGYHATLMFREISESTGRNFFDFIFRGHQEGGIYFICNFLHGIDLFFGAIQDECLFVDLERNDIYFLPGDIELHRIHSIEDRVLGTGG